jgi:hypothetical protein
MSLTTVALAAVVVFQQTACPAPPPRDPLLGETVFRFEASSAMDQLVLSPDGRRVAYTFFHASDEGTYALEVRRLSGGPPLRLVPQPRYAPCVCDGGVGAVSWLDNRRLQVEAGYETDEGDGETLLTFDAWTGRLLSIRDFALARDGIGSVRPDRRSAQRSVNRAFAKMPPGFESQTSLASGYAVSPRTFVLQISAADAYQYGLWSVDLPTSRKRLLVALDDSRFLGGAARIGDALVVYLSGDRDEICVVEGGRLRTLVQLPEADHGRRGFVPVLAGHARLLFLITVGGAAGEVLPGTLYETDGRTARRIDAYPEAYAASTDARGRLVAISSGMAAEVRRLAPEPVAGRRG